MDFLAEIWSRASAQLAPPEQWVVWVTGLVALAVVLYRPTWRVSRHVVTIAHEGAHAFAALVTGRRLSGIRLHSDTSGLTVSSGKPRGFGMILTALAGYVGPGLVGLGAAFMLRQGYAVGLLWLLILVLALMLLQIRNWFGLWSILVSGVVLGAVSWFASTEWQAITSYLVTWFLLLAAPRPVLELQTERRNGRARTSDADMLARLTPFPGLFWVGVFLVVTLGALALGSWWIGAWSVEHLPRF
ncbi:M50 family metallopeptidase [Sanguibacter suaedae]|uniref:M50 family metallopeptidase n=1 Tax=Sanguibacter suaedae TaxID=2795737 RepID=A0A934ID56_9MICO|nr:M50 family metallopeptidase [Sanguibacter suaedae]MBI9115793.1 M50 family metallopeptidase [Sanguibacter suaedae]